MIRACVRVLALFLAPITRGLQADPVALSAKDAPHVRVELVADLAKAEPGKPVRLGFHFKTEPGWHVYWRYPGDSGRAPHVQLATNPSLQFSELQFPAPQVIPFGRLVNYGYVSQPLLFTSATLPVDTVASELALKAKVEWLVCSEECIPGEAELSGVLPISSKGESGPFWEAFETSARSVPLRVEGLSATAEIKDDRFIFDIRVPAGTVELPHERLRFLPYLPRVINNNLPQDLVSDGLGARLTVPRAKNPVKGLKELRGILLSPKGFGSKYTATALELSIGVQTSEQVTGTLPTEEVLLTSTAWVEPEAPAKPIGFLWALVLAFGGGIILNLMPCVFPMLPVKVLSFAKTAGGGALRHGIIFACGVVFSSLALWAVLMVLRASGAQLAWGFHMQNPVVVLGLALVMFALGMNFCGIFELGLGMQKSASRVHCDESPWGSFLSGVLTLLVASPCTAPFMGAALAFALTQSSIASALIFAALGLGIASPYVLLAASPRLLSKLPRPGAWMITLKQGLSFLLFASAAWLVWVLDRQIPGMAAWMLLVFVGAGFFLWLYGHTHRRGIQYLALAGFIGVCLYSATSVSGGHAQAVAGDRLSDQYGQVWEKYSAEGLAALKSQGKAVYLDFTAAWCITCQVNKYSVFGSEDVRKKIQEKGIVLMRGDWTNQDPAITSALASYGRAGVPLNVYYPAKAEQPHVFPSILTASMVLPVL